MSYWKRVLGFCMWFVCQSVWPDLFIFIQGIGYSSHFSVPLHLKMIQVKFRAREIFKIWENYFLIILSDLKFTSFYKISVYDINKLDQYLLKMWKEICPFHWFGDILKNWVVLKYKEINFRNYKHLNKFYFLNKFQVYLKHFIN